jgi:arylsulfatase A-like enzyme
MFAASVSTFDEEVGQLLTKLDELKLREDTIILFQNDHGHSTEDRAFGGGGNAGPYRGAKFSYFEGGIRIPAIVSWPGRLPENQVRGQMICGIDWLPTLAALSGVDLPQHKIDGRSVVEVLRSADAPSPHAELHWMMNNQWAVHQGDWKLLGNPADTSKKAALTAEDRTFLANLADDPGEMKNVAKANPQIVERLTALHAAWATEVKEQ